MSRAKDHARIYRAAAALNRDDALLKGATLHLPDYGQVVMTGDLHGHRRNFQRIKNYCDLEQYPVRHVILHEIIHEEPRNFGDSDMSHEVLLGAAEYKCEYPDQVHFLQSNHELAQLTNQDISKAGRVVTFSFLAGIRESYGAGADEVTDAILEFIASYPLAARTANRILLTHSLPSPNNMTEFDPTVLDRMPNPADLHDGGSAYLLVWGRYQQADQLERLAQMLDADIFICGHQPQETGYETWHNRLLILASDHNHGVLLPFDLKKPYQLADLVKSIRPLASIM